MELLRITTSIKVAVERPLMLTADRLQTNPLGGANCCCFMMGIREGAAMPLTFKRSWDLMTALKQAPQSDIVQKYRKYLVAKAIDGPAKKASMATLTICKGV